MLEDPDLLRTPDSDAYGKAMNLTAKTPILVGTSFRYIVAAMVPHPVLLLSEIIDQLNSAAHTGTLSDQPWLPNGLT